MNEKEFQIKLGKDLNELGFKVYTDKKICELPAFHGDKEKPDLLVFYNENLRKHKLISISNPFCIEIKKEDKLNEITKSILQIKKYKGKNYYRKSVV